jgi:hypothetical protein
MESAIVDKGRYTILFPHLWHTYGTQVLDNSQVIKNEWDRMVDGMGFEPTTPALRTPCSPN